MREKRDKFKLIRDTKGRESERKRGEARQRYLEAMKEREGDERQDKEKSTLRKKEKGIGDT